MEEILELFRYKAAGPSVVDATGQLGTAEFLNVTKDDALAWPKQATCVPTHRKRSNKFDDQPFCAEIT